MNKILSLIAAALICGNTDAQSIITPNDSANTGTAYPDMIFSNLATGANTPASDTDWHLAISVRPTNPPPFGNLMEGVAIRINEGLGLTVAVAANNNASTFDNLDTTGMSNWELLYD